MSCIDSNVTFLSKSNWFILYKNPKFLLKTCRNLKNQGKNRHVSLMRSIQHNHLSSDKTRQFLWEITTSVTTKRSCTTLEDFHIN